MTVLLDDRRLEYASRLEAIQQGAAALVLMTAAYRRYDSLDGGPPLLAGVLFLVGAVLLLAAMREIRGRGSSHIGWLNIAGGIALLVEWAVSMSEGAKVFQPALLLGVLGLGLGVFHAPLQRGRRRRRRLHIDAERITFWLNPFRNFRVRWADLRRVDVGPAALRFDRNDGQSHRLPLGRLRNAADVTAAVVRACRLHGVELRMPDALSSPAPNSP